MPHKLTIQTDPGYVAQMTVAVEIEIADGDDLAEMSRRALMLVDQVRAKQDLLELQVEVQSRTETIERHDELMAAAVENRALQRAKIVRDFRDMDRIRHIDNPRRAEWQPSKQERQKLEEFDIETTNQLRGMEDNKAKCERELPSFQPKIERARAILAGKDRSELIELKVVAQAAD